MGKPIDLSGRKFGKWTVVEKSEPKPGYKHLQFWRCKCECGTEQIRRGSQLLYAERKGANQCCAVCSGTKHGEHKKPEYICWRGMIDRCERPSHKFFCHYGGRGIGVCERWKTYANFLADMGRRPTEKHSLDRIDNNGNYAPENCRWALQCTQTRNKRTTVMLTHNGKTQCVMDWAIETGLSHAAISQRIKTLGWGVNESLSTPIQKAFNWRGTPHNDATRIEYNGENLPHREWEKRLGLSRDSIRCRLARGWTIEKAIGTYNKKTKHP